MNPRCTSMLGLAATLMASSAFAQNAGIAVNTPMSSAMLGQDIHGMACVDLDQNLTMDAVFLVGTTPYLALEPDYWRQYVPLMTSSYSFLDVCAAPGLGTNGSDAVALVGASGLWLVSRQAASGSSQGSLAATRIDTSTNLFVGCKRIVCGDIDNNGDNELIGVSSDGLTLKRAFRVSGAWSTIAMDGTFGTAIDDIDIVDWDGGSKKEIAVLRLNPSSTTTGRCEINFVNSTTSGFSGTYYWSMPGVGIAMSKFRHRGRDYDQIALTYRYGSPQYYWFTVFGSEAPVLSGETKPHEAGFTLGPIQPIELTSGHVVAFDEDENPTAAHDIVITHTFSPDQLLLPNVSNGDPDSASFSNASEFIWLLPLGSFTTPYTNFSSTAGIADFDGDGDGDVLIPSRASGNVSLFRNGLSYDESEFKIYFDGEGCLTEVTDSLGTYHNLTIDIAQASKLVSAADRLIVMVYRQPVVSGVPQPIEEVSGTHALTNVWYDVSSLALNSTMQLTFPIYESTVSSANRYHIVIRPMSYDGENSVYTHAYPATKYVFSFQNTVFDELVDANADYFAEEGGGGGGDVGLMEATWGPLPIPAQLDFSQLSSLWLSESDSIAGSDVLAGDLTGGEITGGGNGGQSSGGTGGNNPTKKGGTQTGGVVVVVVPDPFGGNNPPPRPNASQP